MDSAKRSAAEPGMGSPAKVLRILAASPSMQSPTAIDRYICHHCGVAFTAATNMTRHIESQHGVRTFACEECSKTFSRKDKMLHHMKTHLPKVCGECGKPFPTKVSLAAHRKNHKNVPLCVDGDPQPPADPRNPTSSTCPPVGCKTALNGSYERHRVNGEVDDVGLSAFLRAQPHADLLRDAIRRKKGVKFFVSANVTMIRPKGWITHGTQESAPYFTSRCHRVLEATNIEELLELTYSKIVEDLSQYLREGSGWVIGHINFADLVISTYKPMNGSSYIRLPPQITKTRSVINVKNNDDRCFIWAILSALHPVSRSPHSLHHYKPYEESLNLADLMFPMVIDDIPKFERLNNISINLFGYREQEVFPIYISEPRGPSINLLLLSNGSTQHYCWIKNFTKFMCNMERQDFFCVRCLHGFSARRQLDRHMESCVRYYARNNETL